MNLEKLFEMQRVLDERIIKEKGLEGQDLLPNTILALQVELGELANEWRGFKHWSNDREPRTRKVKDCDRCNAFETYRDCPICKGDFEYVVNPLLEEYVDCLHFILSIGLQTGMHFLEEVQATESSGGLIQQFLSLNKQVGRFQFAYEVDLAGGFETANFCDAYQFAFRLFIGLGNLLGFTWEQIEQAYLDKNKVNHERQTSGY